MTRELTRDDLDFAYEVGVKPAVEMFNESGEVFPVVLFMILADEPRTVDSIAMLDPNIVNMLQSSQHSKRVLTWLIRSTLDGRGPIFDSLRDKLDGRTPDVAVHVTEARHVELKDAAELEAYRNSGMSASEHPNRDEVIIGQVHTLHKTWSGRCKVEGPERKAVYSPLDINGETRGFMAMQGDAPNSSGH